MRKADCVRETELLFGVHSLLELLKAKKRKIFKIYTLRDESEPVKLVRKICKYPVEINHCSREELTRRAGSPDHQGIVAMVSPFQFRTKPFDPTRYRAIVMLDGIQDPRNLGALLRSAHCTGFNGVIITRKNSAPINAVCIKASAGLAEHIEIYQVPSAAAGVQELKKNGYNMYITTLRSGAMQATDIAYQIPLCVVIGSEGTGVSPAIIKEGTPVYLPQRAADISYNASVAGALMMFLIATQHKLFGA